MGLAGKINQGKLNDAIKYAEQSIQINFNKIRPKIILAIAKTRIGEADEAIKILNDLYSYQKIAEVALAISDYYNSFDDSKQQLMFLRLHQRPKNKDFSQLASLHLFDAIVKKQSNINLKFTNIMSS